MGSQDDQIITLKSKILAIQEKRDKEIESINQKVYEERIINVKNICKSFGIDYNDIVMIIPTDEAKIKQKKVNDEIKEIKLKADEEIRILNNEIRKIKKPMKINKYEKELQNVIEKINKDNDKINKTYLGNVGVLLEKLLHGKDIDYNVLFLNAKKSYLNMLAK